MLIDMLNGFSDYYKKHGDKIILDHYKMKQGLYVLINDNGIKSSLYIKEGMKEKDFEDDADKKKLFNYFKARDYLSILLLYDTNKKIASKSIHSNNFLTLFAKKKSFFEKDKVSYKMTAAVNDYFDTFKKFYSEEMAVKSSSIVVNPKQEILKQASEFNYKLYIQSRESIINSLTDILQSDELKALSDDDYIRIFYESEIKYYNIEYLRYMVRKVFNKDKYHIYKNGEVYGLSSADMGTNPNKPSLELKNLKVQVPFRINFETAIMLQKLFDFLFFYNVKKKNKDTGEIEHINSIYKTLYIPSDFNIDNLDLTDYREVPNPIYYVKTGNGISFNIVDFDVLPPFSQRVDFELINYLDIKDNNSNLSKENGNKKNIFSQYRNIEFLYQLEKTIDYNLFNWNLVKNYFDDKIKISNSLDSSMIPLIYSSRNAFYEWFRKGYRQDISNIIDDLTINIIKNKIMKITGSSDLYKIGHIFNVRLSLLNYFHLGGGSILCKEGIQILKQNIFLKLQQENDLECDNEFYYLSGQIIFYLLSKSSSANKTQLMIKPYINCTDIKALKQKISMLYSKYSYAIKLYDKRFNRAYSILMNYKNNSLIKDYIDVFMTGLLSKNIFYTKKEDLLKKE